MIKVPRGSYTPTFERRPEQAPPGPAPVVDHAARRRPWRPGLGTLAIALLVAIPLAFTAWRTGLWTSVGSATPMVTIAVLPFNEYASDVADARLAAQLTDGVTGELARSARSASCRTRAPGSMPTHDVRSKKSRRP